MLGRSNAGLGCGGCDSSASFLSEGVLGKAQIPGGCSLQSTRSTLAIYDVSTTKSEHCNVVSQACNSLLILS